MNQEKMKKYEQFEVTQAITIENYKYTYKKI